MPTSTDTVQQLVRQLYGLGLVQREIDRHALAQLGSQGFAALAIVGLHGPLRVSDVAARLHVDLSVASRQVAALDRAGHVTRDARRRRPARARRRADRRRPRRAARLAPPHGRRLQRAP